MEGQPLVLGTGFIGGIDDVSISIGEPTPVDSFSRDPYSCIDNDQHFSCLEESVLVPAVDRITRRELRYDVPLRFKSVYDPMICNPLQPCPLVVLFTCKDGYTPDGEVSALVSQGNFVATLDNFCVENELSTNQWTYQAHEMTQVSQVSTHLFTSSPLKDLLIAGTVQVHGTGRALIQPHRQAKPNAAKRHIAVKTGRSPIRL
jgi:hypothetical protein